MSGKRGNPPIIILDDLVESVPGNFAQMQAYSILMGNSMDNQMYQKDTQKIYRQLRKDGITAAEARETIELMTGEKAASAPMKWWGANEAPRTHIPYYHHKRKF